MKLYPVVSTIIIIHLILWLFTGFFQFEIGEVIYQFAVGHNLLVALGQYWRLVTPIFLHVDLMHFLFNSFALVLFGPALEQMLGKLKFIIAYLATGIIANIATFLLEPPLYQHLGASGAIYGLFGIYIFMVVYRKHLIDYTSSRMITTILIIGIIMTFVGSNINIVAHLIGFAAGFAIAPLVLRNARPYTSMQFYEASYPDNHGEIAFNPNRWNKRNQFLEKLKRNWLWILIGIFAIIGLISRF
jgi:membrane associated rhomboid family serine protease